VNRVVGDFQKGEEVIVLDPDGNALATGVARMSSEEMRHAERGAAVKVRWAERSVPPAEGPKADWNLAIEANAKIMERRTRESVEFILKLAEEHRDIPQVVSFSGGKDSLVTLLLTREAGLDLPVFFINTGLEFPETVSYVHRSRRS
jgi:phosphoadenosine phosphosulfate reductase